MVQNAGKVGSTLARGAVDLMMTSIPNLLPQMIEAVAPGMLGAYQDAVRIGEAGQAWERVSQAKGQNQQPLYQNLPAYRSKEYFAAVAKTERELGLEVGSGIDNMQLRDARGTPLPPQAQYEAKMRMIARVASGLRPQPANPAQITKAVNAGRQQERTQQTRRAQGRAMGAGATSQQFSQEPEADPVRAALQTAIREQNGASRPFGNV